jgi:hypothetical protein
MKEQTAVEWLYDELSKIWYDKKLSEQLLEQAKAMEKEHISVAYETGWVNGDLKKAPRFGQDYFNEIIKNK